MKNSSRTCYIAAWLVLGAKPFYCQSVSAADVFTRTSPAVVMIETFGNDGKKSGSGSGFIVSSDGKIITNEHVIAGATKATVRLASGDAYDDVSVLDTDHRKDIALLKTKALDLPTLGLGKSANVKVGDSLFAVTNPLGILKNTLSSGIVSGIREMDGYRVFQMTVAISPGSSGGPVLNGASEVVGIAASMIQAGQSLNFSIPIDYAKGMIASPSLPRAISSVPNIEEAAQNTASVKAVPENTPPNLQLLETKLYKWTQQDAIAVFGEPTGREPAYDVNTRKVNGEVLIFPDRTRTVLTYKLTFGNADGLLRGALAFPLNLTWDAVKKVIVGKYNVLKQPDGSRIYALVDKRWAVLVKNDKVISIGVY